MIVILIAVLLGLSTGCRMIRIILAVTRLLIRLAIMCVVVLGLVLWILTII